MTRNVRNGCMIAKRLEEWLHKSQVTGGEVHECNGTTGIVSYITGNICEVGNEGKRTRGMVA
jgi:hypothetical protein